VIRHGRRTALGRKNPAHPWFLPVAARPNAKYSRPPHTGVMLRLYHFTSKATTMNFPLRAASTFLLLTGIGLGSISAAALLKEPANYEGKDIRKQDVTKFREDLRGAIFRDAIASECNFRRLDLTGASFVDANVKYAHFDNAVLTKADFAGALFETTYFAYAKMDGANLEGQNDFDATQVETLRGANLKGAQIEGQPENTDFREADLRSADLSQVSYFPNARWKGALYNSETIWMKGFDPERAGCIKKEADDAEEASGSKKN
jgi:uncharacterized protein YjbI with pentapeptide repeats